jgi:hypothetical protein
MATRGDILCKLEVHGPSLPASQRQGTRPGCRSVMHLRRSHRVVMSSSLANRSTFMTTTKGRVMPPSTRFSVQILPLPSPTPRPLTALVAHTFSIRRTRACALLFQHVEPFTTVSVPRGQISPTASQPRPFLAGVHHLVDLEALVLNPLQIRTPITHHTALNSTKVPTILR